MKHEETIKNIEKRYIEVGYSGEKAQGVGKYRYILYSNFPKNLNAKKYEAIDIIEHRYDRYYGENGDFKKNKLLDVVLYSDSLSRDDGDYSGAFYAVSLTTLKLCYVAYREVSGLYDRENAGSIFSLLEIDDFNTVPSGVVKSYEEILEKLN